MDAKTLEKNIRIRQAKIWQIEHTDELFEIMETHYDLKSIREELKQRYGFEDFQAWAILDMRIRSYSLEEREKLKNELKMLENEMI